MGAGGPRGGRFEGVHRHMCLWHQHASRCTGRCAKDCRVSTGLVVVGVVVLMLSDYIIMLQSSGSTAACAVRI